MKNTLYFIALLLLISSNSYAQLTLEINPEYSSGYHFNVFRTPLSIEKDSVFYDADSLVSKGWFHQFDIGLKPSYQKGKHLIKFNNSFKYKLFHQLPEGNELAIKSGLD